MKQVTHKRNLGRNRKLAASLRSAASALEHGRLGTAALKVNRANLALNPTACPGKIVITVSGGVAEEWINTVPRGYMVEIFDYDNFKASGGNVDGFISEGSTSAAIVEFLRSQGGLE